MATTDKLRGVLNSAPDADFLTPQQRRKVQKALAKERVEVTVTVTGGEVLELEDMAAAQGVDLDEFLVQCARHGFRALYGHPLGFAYQVHDDDFAPPKLGRKLRRALGLSKSRTRRSTA